MDLGTKAPHKNKRMGFFHTIFLAKIEVNLTFCDIKILKTQQNIHLWCPQFPQIKINK